jgi:hypothetical protein
LQERREVNFIGVYPQGAQSPIIHKTGWGHMGEEQYLHKMFEKLVALGSTGRRYVYGHSQGAYAP